GLDAGSASPVWPIACALGGVIIAAGGVTAARLGHRWPGMSARYDRHPPTPAASPAAPGSAAAAASAGSAAAAASAGSAAAAGSAASGGSASATSAGSTMPAGSTASARPTAEDNRATWDALDRGDDPTAS
ncbi:MAG: Trp biosynthesis-associated membrane protein, partial [Actinoplanes sp.]